jgi:hypothetical protein
VSNQCIGAHLFRFRIDIQAHIRTAQLDRGYRLRVGKSGKRAEARRECDQQQDFAAPVEQLGQAPDETDECHDLTSGWGEN